MHLCHLTCMAHHSVYCFPMKRLEHRTSKLDEFLGGRRDLENYLKEGRCNRRVFVPPPFFTNGRLPLALVSTRDCLLMRAVSRHTTSDRVGSWTTITSKPILRNVNKSSFLWQCTSSIWIFICLTSSLVTYRATLVLKCVYFTVSEGNNHNTTQYRGRRV